METKLGQVVVGAAVQPQIPVSLLEVPGAVTPGEHLELPVGCGHQCLWAVFSGCVFQSGTVQQLPYQWSCIILSLWLPVFAGIVQNIPAAMGF